MIMIEPMIRYHLLRHSGVTSEFIVPCSVDVIEYIIFRFYRE